MGREGWGGGRQKKDERDGGRKIKLSNRRMREMTEDEEGEGRERERVDRRRGREGERLERQAECKEGQGREKGIERGGK